MGVPLQEELTSYPFIGQGGTEGRRVIPRSIQVRKDGLVRPEADVPGNAEVDLAVTRLAGVAATQASAEIAGDVAPGISTLQSMEDAANSQDPHIGGWDRLVDAALGADAYPFK